MVGRPFFYKNYYIFTPPNVCVIMNTIYQVKLFIEIEIITKLLWEGKQTNIIGNSFEFEGKYHSSNMFHLF